MEQRSRKIPVTDRQFLWVQDDDKGEVTLHVGPTMVSPTAADRVVIDDGRGGLQEDTTGAPQSMIELGVRDHGTRSWGSRSPSLNLVASSLRTDASMYLSVMRPSFTAARR